MALVNGKRKGKEVDTTGIILKRMTTSAVSTTNDNIEEQIARFFYTSGIPLSVIKSDEFLKMWDSIARYGPGFVPPSCDELKGKYLKQRVTETKESIEEHRVRWKKTGCSILIDGWTNNKGMTICNFFVNSLQGIVFLKSVNASDICKNVDSIFKMIDEVVEEVGEENVVQVVNNLGNYKAVGKMLMEKRKRIWWTPCVAYCIGLMLEDFENKLVVHKETIANAKRITSYIYSRKFLIALLHHFTKGKDLVKPAVTKSATSYLTLGSLNDNKEALMRVFTSKQWKSSYYAATSNGKHVVNVVKDGKFWKNIGVCLKGANPLIKILHLVSSDEKPAMGFIYEEMNRAKEKIQSAFKRAKRRYMPLLDIIDGRWDKELLNPLHATAYYLNPKFHYSPNFKDDIGVKCGLYGCLVRMARNKDASSKIGRQLEEDFKNARNLFGSEIAKIAIKTKNPEAWWDSYGFEYPQLQDFATRILSLTCCSSGCERNRNAFDMFHTKRRNRLKQKKMNDVMFVMSNSKLAKRNQARKAIEYTMDDLSSDDEWITEDDGSLSKEELELDNWDWFVPIENDAHEDQVGEDVNGDNDLVIHDDDAELDVSDEDGASNATDDGMDSEGDQMED